MVRCEISCGGLRKIIVSCRFPTNYPCSAVLLELKSKTLSEELLKNLTKTADIEAAKYLGKPQILNVIKFLKKFLVENPLCVCYDEISNVKKLLASHDEIKLKQKTSTLHLSMAEGGYFFKVKIKVPDEYYSKPASISDFESNFPNVMERFLLGQASFISRKCSEPPLTRLVKFKGGKERPVAGKVIKVPPNTQFQEVPSLEKMARFLITTCRRFLSEHCQVCRKKCLPNDPKAAQRDEQAGDHVERVYCGHLFHLSCLLIFMKTPPFQGGKKCGACGELISHEKWKLSERQAENRWAHEEARNRELQEVAEFFN